MAEKEDKSLDQQIKEAELAKLKAETADVEKHSKQVRVMGVPIVQVIFGGIVVGFVLLNYIQPLVNLNTDIAGKEKDYNEIQDRLERIKLEARSKNLELLADSLQTEQIKLAALNEALKQETKDLEEKTKKAEANLANVQKRVTALDAQEKKLLASLESEKSRVIINEAFRYIVLDSAFYAIILKQYQMIKAKNYYDAGLNPEGKGIYNQFQLQPGDSVIFDAATGLTWQQSGSTSMPYSEVAEYIREINVQSYGGYTDWRLPTLEEAMSLIQAEEKNHSHRAVQFNFMQGNIWTSDKINTSRAWLVRFSEGRCRPRPIGQFEYVRAVRKDNKLNVSK